MSTLDPSNGCYRFSDCLAQPDPYYSDYELNFKGKDAAIVIDNGSSQMRVGWSGELEPRLKFHNCVARTRGRKGEGDIMIAGNDITNIEVVRSSVRTQFDQNIVTHYGCQELLLDHSFSHLGLGQEATLNHPIVITEPACNPNCCRSAMSELLFECYSAPSVAYGVDALFSYHYNQASRGGAKTGLVITSGYQATHILPIVDNKLDASHCKRISVGGAHCTYYMQRLMQLKQPHLQNAITISRAQELVEHHTYMALEYPEELLKYSKGEGENRIVQLYSFPQVGASAAEGDVGEDGITKEEREKQRKRKAAERLREINKRKKMEKLEELKDLVNMKETDVDEYEVGLEKMGFGSHEELQQAMDKLELSLNNKTGDQGIGQDNKDEEVETPENLAILRQRKMELLEQRQIRQQQKQEMSKRRSAASHKRMKIISQLAEEVSTGGRKKKDKEDTFGQNDDDWHIYREINKDVGDSESEKEEAELVEIDKVLSKYGSGLTPSVEKMNTQSMYQLLLGIEQFRVPEVIYQPNMLGVEQGGVAETMQFVLSCYPTHIQQELVNNVFVTGGNTKFPQFGDRLGMELRAMRPFQSQFHVAMAGDLLLDSWRGASWWAGNQDNRHHFISRLEYQEMGGDYLKEHATSNVFVPYR
ncbi:actin-related protein 5-like [Dysidea avara]|uniref:actin-related protein 5-like n=1 Tax=Dysidea avara TaxID=196820 RepID=UPI00331A0C62